MARDILAATTNEGKIERYRKLIAHSGIFVVLHAPIELGIKNISAEENGATLSENASMKARAYFGAVDMPILANDTGFYVEGEGLVDAPKRAALGARDEKNLSEEEKSELLIRFWQSMARKHGGRVDASWIDSFVLLLPNGDSRKSEARREVILTDTIFGKTHVQLPIRSLYISKATGKPAALHTKEEDLQELLPISNALFHILRDEA
ncbi:MAG: hypothetical protein HYU05_00825 [Candidatus Wildermuthbacteria bacterium]|nr:hypothetical protein [Candidatus Wildermuthbacteria bacterium]